MPEEIAVKKERELKDDGRYIIFYVFENENKEAPREAARESVEDKG